MSRTKRNGRIAGWMAAGWMLGLSLGAAQAAVVFQDDIEPTSFDGIGSTDPWQINVPADLSTATTYGAQVGAYHGILNANSGFRSLASVDGGPLQAFAPATELWVDVHTYVGTDSAGGTGRVGFFGAAGTLPVTLDFVGNGDGTYAVKTLRSGGYHAVAGLGALANNTWEHWRFAVKLDTVSGTLGDGTFSIYREVAGDWQTIVEDQAYNPFSAFSTDSLNSLRIQSANGSGAFLFGFDGVVVYDSQPPVPEPASLGLVAAGALLMARRRS